MVYVEKNYTVSAGGSIADIFFRRTGEKAVFLHYLKTVTDANTAKAEIYVDGYKFSPSLGASTTFELGKYQLFDKMPINDNISVNITASSTASTTVTVYAYVEVATE